MENNIKIQASLIEIEVEDISSFEEEKNNFVDAVHIQMVISGEEALSKNATGELGLLNYYMIDQNIVLNLMSLQYTDTLKANIEMMNYILSEKEQSYKHIMKDFRDDARKQLKEAGYDNFKNCAYALDPYIGGSMDMFLNEPIDSYARTRLTELLRMHIDEIKPGKNHILELVIEV